jgi:4-hydroxy-3-methylbut-2-enyl diphosphate reductase IspH
MVLIQISVWGQVTINSPVSSSNVSSIITIDFNLSTAATTGTLKVTFTENGTSLDDIDPHILTLETIHETSGNHSFTFDASDFSNNVTNVASYTGGSALVDGAIYDVKVEYSDGTAYDATNTGITYDITAPTLVSASRNSDTELIVTLSEECNGIANGNDGGFTVSETGNAGITYEVSATAQGADASHVVLTVASMAISGKEGVTVTYTAGGNGTVNDLAGNSLANDATGVAVSPWDETLPTISSGTLATSNAYLDIDFSEGVYGANDGATALTADKLALTFTQNGGNATNATISSVKKNDNEVEGSATALTGGEITVRVFLTITGTPSGVETIEVKPADGSSVYDAAGNAMSTGETTVAKTLNDQLPPTLVSASRNSDTELIVTLSEECNGIANDNDGGFTVSETGTPAKTYAVSATTQGVDASHVVLTVASIATSGKEGVTVSYTAGGNGTVNDLAGNSLVTNLPGVAVLAWDESSPTITSGTIATENTYIDILFSEGVYGADDGATELTADKLALTFTQNEGDATNATIHSVKQTDNADEALATDLAGGETMVRVFLTITGTPSGVETIEVTPADAASLYDAAGNAMLETQTTEVKTLYDQLAPTVFSIVRKDAALELTNAASVDFTVSFDEPVTGVTTANFSLDGTASEASVSSVTKVGAGAYETTWTVSVTTGGTDGTVRLDLSSNLTSIADEVGNELSTTYTTGELYTVDTSAPSAPTITGIADDTGVNSSDGITSDQTLIVSGTAEAGASIEVFIDAGSIGTASADGSGDWSLDHTGTTLTEGDYVITATATDAAGNESSASAGFSVTVDNTDPTVVLSDNHPDAIVKNGDEVTITATFTEANSIDEGTPPTITIGSVVTSAAMTKSSNLEWAYAWTVPTDNDGEATVSIAATDVAGNANTAATGKTAYTVDNTKPTVVLADDHDDAIVKNGDAVNITATFTETNGIDEGTPPTITIGSVVTSAAMTKSSNLEWTYAWTVPTDNDGEATVSIAATDVAGNANTAATGKTSYTIDNTKPTVSSIALQDPATSPTNSTSLTFRITFSEPVYGFALGDVTKHEDGASGTLTGFTGADGDTQFDVTATSVSGNGAFGISVAASVCADGAGNPNEAGAQVDYTVDNIDPTCSIALQDPATSPTNSTSLTFRITFSEPVYGFALGDVTKHEDGASGTLTGFTGADGDTQFDVTATSVSGNGAFGISVAASVCADGAGNPNEAGAQVDYTVDKTAPTVLSINRSDPTEETTNATTVKFLVTFSEPVSNVNSTNFSLTTSDVSGTIQAFSGATGTTVEVTVASIAIANSPNNGTLRLDLNDKSGVVDAANNELAATREGDQSYTIDQATQLPNFITPEESSSGGPTIFLSFELPEDAKSNTVKMTFTRTGGTNYNPSEHVITFNNTNNFELSGSHSTNLDGQNIVGNENVESVTNGNLKDAAIYTVTLEYQDLLGNPVSSVSKTSFTYTTVPLTATIASISPNPRNSAVTDLVNVDFNRGVWVDKVNANDFILTLDGGAPISLTGLPITYSNTFTRASKTYAPNFHIDLSTFTTGEGDYLLTLTTANDDIVDKDGNKLSANASTTWETDLTDPFIESITTTVPDPTNANPISVTVVFSEAVYELLVGEISVTNGTASNLQTTNNITYTFDITPTADGEVSVNIPAGVCHDAAANTNTVSATLTRISDRTKPNLTKVILTSDNENAKTAVLGDEITLDFEANETIQNLSVFIGGYAVTPFNVTGNRWIAYKQVENDFPEFISFTISCKDVAGNQTDIEHKEEGETRTFGTTNGSFVVFDNTEPTVSSFSIENGTYILNENLDITVIFNEDVVVTGTPKLTFQIGTETIYKTVNASYVSGSGSSNLVFRYTIVADEFDEDGIKLISPIDLNGGDIQDLAGNSIVDLAFDSPATSEVLVDGIKPTLSTVNRSIPVGELTNLDEVIFLATFSEGLSGVDIADFTLTTSGSVTGTITSVTFPDPDPGTNDKYEIKVSSIAGSGSLRLDLRDSNTGITDIAGNPISGGFAGGQSYTIDKTSPTVVLSDNHTDAIVKNGDVITITATFTENVNMPKITIAGLVLSQDMAGADNVWTYSWAVPVDHNGSVGVSISATDIAGNANAAATGKTSYTVDNTQPTVELTDNHPDDIVRSGDVLTITATFTEANIIDEGSKPTITIGTLVEDADMTMVSNLTWRYVWTVPAGAENDGNVTVSISASDVAGNTNAAATGKTLYTVDNTQPTVVLTDNHPDAIVKGGETVIITATFSETVNTPKITIGNLVLSQDMSGAGADWTYTWNVPADYNGTVGVSISATDIAGNANTAATVGVDGTNSYTVDNTQPTVVLSDNHPDALVKNGDEITITATFTEANGIDEDTPPQITIGGNTYVMQKSTNLVWTYEWTVSEPSDGGIALIIAARDVASNASAEATGKTSYTVDNTQPTVTLSDNHPDAIVRHGDVVTITATFTEANGIEEGSKPKITIGGLVANAEMTMASNLIWRYVWTVPSGAENDGNVTVSISASDVAGNTNAAATGKTLYTVDNTQPTVVLTDNHPDAIVKGGETVIITATFSETVNTPKITIGNLVLSQDMSGAGADWTYTWNVPSDYNGTVGVSISATDIAGNANTAATAGVDGTTSYTVDNTQPTVVLSDNHPDALVKNGDEITITATFTEANGIDEDTPPQITISGSTYAMQISTNLVWTYEWTVSEPNGNVPVSITAFDVAGNTNQSATGKTIYTVDSTLPTLTSLAISSDYSNPNRAKEGSIITINFTSSEQIQNVSATILGGAASITNIAGDMWKATYEIAGTETILGTDKVVDFSINFEDIAGNTTSASNADITNGSSVTLDITPPNLTPILIYSDHSNADRARVGSLITLEFNASESIENVTATINTKNASVEFDSGSNSWFAYYYMKSTDAEGELSFTIDYKDLAGNAGQQKNTITTGDNVTFDKVKPTFSSVTIYSDNSVSTAHAADGNTVFLGFATSEAVETPVVTINGISATSITGGPTSWIASRVLSSGENEGVLPFTIDASDLAGNEAQTRFSTTDASSVTFDDSSPGISTVTVKSGVYKVDDVISVFIQADNNNYAGQTIEVNGKEQTLINNNNNTYSINYLVEEGDNDVFESGSLPINVVFKDLAGNTSTRTEANSQGGTITLDANTPVIQSVVSTAEDVGNLIIDDQIVFTVTPETPEEGLVVQPAVYNSKPLVWSTTDGGATFSSTYTVTEGDDKQETPLQLAPVTLTDAAGNASASVAYSDIQKSIYATRPTATISGTTTKCDYGQMVPIRFDFTGYSPYQLTYSDGTVDVGPVEVTDDFYEFEAESGTFTLVNLTDAKGNFSTSALQNAVVTVKPLPEITLNILGSPFNVNDPRVYLADFATPAGGTFSGDGVSANGYFYPSMIDLEDDAKTVPLTYTYSDANGCENSASQDVIVSSGGAVIEGVQSPYCQYNASFDVVGKNPNSIIGWFNMPTSTKGWTDNGDNTLTISPQELNAGEHTIEYFYVDGGTTFDTERTFVIDSVGANIDFGPLQATYCADDDVVAIQAQNQYPSGGTGYFVGPANGFGTQPGSNQATFEPSLVGEFDKSYEISYYYQSPQGCVSNTIVKQVQVNSLPILSFDIRDNYNYNESPVALQGNFTEGVFTATGGIVVDNILYPDRKEPGAINITYFYQDPVTGCSNSLTKPSRIREAAEVIEGLSSIYCYSTNTVTISSEVTDDATIVGTFTSSKGGIVSVDGNTALYSIAKAGSGTDKVTFSYSIGDTPYEVSTSVLIDSIGPVSITGLGEHFCADDSPVEIRGYLENAPQGTRSLSYSGTPLAFNSTGSVATLSPALEEQGVFNVNFTFTSVASGCSRDTTYSFEIHPLPSVSTDIPDYYNIDAEPLGLVGSPSGGVFSAERGVSGSELYPEVAGAGTHGITYTYTDEFGCVNSALHNIVIIGADGEIAMPSFTCIDSEPLTISATTSNGLVGEFIGKGITNSGDDEAVFDPSIAGKGVHTITYKYLFVDDAETELFLTRDIEVDSLGKVEIYGLEEMYCYNDPSALLTASPAGGNFTSTEYLVVNRFYPSMSSTESLNPVTYTYTSSRTGCSITGTTDVSVRPVPQVNFSVEQSCSDLETDPVQFVNNTKSDDPIDSWKWSFDSQGFATSNEESPNYLYLTSGSKLVTLIASTTFGCESQMDSIVNVGLVPKANFSWENECQNNREAILTSSSESANIVNYKWELPDGTTYEGETLNTVGHVFPEVDTYNVKLVITSQENCKDSIVKPIRILPVVKFDEISGEFYFENFEANDGNWLARGITESDDYSWSLGEPDGEIISSAASGQNAWYTHIDMASQAVEKSQVVSPCFDFSGLERPMLKMGIWSSPVAGRNGAVVQFTTDDGKTWETLGEEESGINWYNSSSIQSQPGGQITGWSSDEMESWEVARHSLDELKGETNVRFRIAFASDGLAIDYFDGFAFDDIWIGNREQNLLVEYFTNAILSTTSQPNSQMAQLEEANSLDIVPIHYHTDSPYGDPLFNLFPSGISARQFFYGVTGIPYALANGTEEFNFSSFGVNQTSIVNIERLKDPSMGISVSGTAGNSLDLNVKIRALESIENQELVVHCAIVQKQYVLDEAINNQAEFYNVIRQFIPDPGGTQIKSVWNVGDEEHLILSWQIPANLDKELLSVVVFVQNVQTQKVYQVNVVSLSDITTSHTPDTEQSVALYPNPATSKVRIESPQDIEQVSIIDASGRVLKVIAVHNTQIDLDVNELKVGLYIVNIKFKGGFKALRFVKK